MRSYYNYRIEGFQHRQRVFVWQLASSKVIFVFVLFVVFAGIYFAAVQFHAGLHQQNHSARKEAGRTEVNASLRGIKVSSPVLGVIILAISLVFFYLYLVFVYPITDTF